MKTKSLHLFLLSFLFLFIQCKEKNPAETNEISTAAIEENTASTLSEEIHTELYGLYMGQFFGDEESMKKFNEGDEEKYYDYWKKITLKINRITQDSVFGQSIVDGKQRPFKGLFDEEKMRFILEEPGDDKTDGKFEITIKEDSLNGTWTAFNPKNVKAPRKIIKTGKREFKYSPDYMLSSENDLIDWEDEKTFIEKYTDEETGKTETYEVGNHYRVASDAVFKLNASKDKLTEKDLKNLRKLDLEIIKNAVYARHGYAFKKRTYRNFFEETNWYVPVSDDVENELSKLEKENIDLLVRFIKYAEDRYDYFGR